MPDSRAGDYPTSEPLSVVVIGASGDLALKKIFPALFALYMQDLLPERFHIFGFARTAMDDGAFRAAVSKHLTCRYTADGNCHEEIASFLQRCYYVAGQYDSADSFLNLYAVMHGFEGEGRANRMYYMSIPPFLFDDVARAVGDAGLVSCGGGPGWSRAVIEKPFGQDRASSDELVSGMAQIFVEDQTYRIDHYLGKEVVQNLLVLRLANLIFEPLWNRTWIENVHIQWKEDIGVETRAGYFDQYGIIRDVMQNHLLQMLSLIAMEPPVNFEARHISNEKAKVLSSIAPLTLDRLVVGQYEAATYQGQARRGYLEEKDIPADSVTPTFAGAVLHINNQRWAGVPFLLTAGKGLDGHLAEIRLRFRQVPGEMFRRFEENLESNELVIRIQPDAAIYFCIVNKAPGLEMKLVQTTLNLRYESAFKEKIPDAYESLLLDVIQGDRSLFIRKDELAAAWDIFTPVLHELEEQRIQPERYGFGTRGPERASALAAQFGFWQKGGDDGC